MATKVINDADAERRYTGIEQTGPVDGHSSLSFCMLHSLLSCEISHSAGMEAVWCCAAKSRAAQIGHRVFARNDRNAINMCENYILPITAHLRIQRHSAIILINGRNKQKRT